MAHSAHRRTKVALTFLLFIPLSCRAAQMSARPNYYPDNSDWSGLNPTGPDFDQAIQPQERELTSSNFRVLSIRLSDKMFDQAAARLGKAQVLQRGDASAGRSPACYVSAADSQKVFLVFEQGEVDFTFHLFCDSRPWNGIDRCTPSPLVSYALATASGLHLGQSQAEVIAILGTPTTRRRNELVYSLHVRTKNSAEDLKTARKNNPDMNDADFHSNFDFSDLNISINAKFTAAKLSYLAVSKSETN